MALWQSLSEYSYSLTRCNKKDISPLVPQQKSAKFKHIIGDHADIYTNGSWITDRVSCTMVPASITGPYHLNQVASIYTVKEYAVILVLSFMLQNSIKSAIICTDSLSSLHAMGSL